MENINYIIKGIYDIWDGKEKNNSWIFEFFLRDDSDKIKYNIFQDLFFC